MRILLGILLLASGTVWAATGIRVENVRASLEQGGFAVLRVPPGSSALFEGKLVAVGEDGVLVLGFDRKQKRDNILKICVNEVCEEKVIRVKSRQYLSQKVTKVPQNTVEPSKEEQKRIAADNAAIAASKNEAIEGANDHFTNFSSVFDLPVEARTSGVYGSSRSYNGKELGSWHKGHDLAALPGSPVSAPAEGVVRLARNTFLSGNLIILDHGAGLQTVYAHLQDMAVQVGDRVRRGQVIGRVGSTGRSSGPHLHWGMYWLDVSIDPVLWVGDDAYRRVQRKGL